MWTLASLGLMTPVRASSRLVCACRCEQLYAVAFSRVVQGGAETVQLVAEQVLKLLLRFLLLSDSHGCSCCGCQCFDISLTGLMLTVVLVLLWRDQIAE